MAIRIVGVDLPQNKRGVIALTYIYGIGRSSAAKILAEAGVSEDTKVKDWTDAEAAKVREVIGENYKVEGDLRSEVQMNIKRLMDIGCYRAFATATVCQCAVRALRTTLALARDARKLLLTRRKLLNNFKVWQRKQSQLRRELLKLMEWDSSTCTLRLTTLLCASLTARGKLFHGLRQARWDFVALKRTLLTQPKWQPKTVLKWPMTSAYARLRLM